MIVHRVRQALFALFVLALVAGGANRTLALRANESSLTGLVALGSTRNGVTMEAHGDGLGGGYYGSGDGEGTGAGEPARAAASRPPRATEWTLIEGRVTRIDAKALLIEVAGGERLLVEGQTWAYAQGEGFSAAVGDPILLDTFQEAGETKPGSLANQASGQEVVLRDRDGWPMWSQGRWR